MKIIRFNDHEYTPASHEDSQWPGVLKKTMLTKDHFIKGEMQMVNWALLPMGKSFRAHFHEDMQEVFIIVQGAALITVDSHSAELRAGDAVVLPPHSVHTMKNIGEQDVLYIALGISRGEGGKTVVV